MFVVSKSDSSLWTYSYKFFIRAKEMFNRCDINDSSKFIRLHAVKRREFTVHASGADR